MGRKVTWLTIWITLTFWYGCGRQESAQHPERYSELVIAESDITFVGVPAPAPSVTGLDRPWEPITLAPTPGTVRHGPAYLSTQIDPSPVLSRSGDISAMATNVTEHNAMRLTGGSFSTVFTEPTFAAFDIVTLPVAMIVQPPWTTGYSPQSRR
jgi:hypothetical protein